MRHTSLHHALSDSVDGSHLASAPSYDPCRQLERLQSSLTASTSQLKQLQSELGARDAEVAQLRAEAETTRKRLHLLQASSGQPHCCSTAECSKAVP
jgi:septal ring factor EnvC (AmiA/AmiB activator)